MQFNLLASLTVLELCRRFRVFINQQIALIYRAFCSRDVHISPSSVSIY